MGRKKKTESEDYVVFEDDFVVRNRKKEKVLSELDELDFETPTLISSDRPVIEKKHKSEAEQLKEETSYDAENEWLTTISNFKTEKLKKSKRSRRGTGLFDYYEKDKKGKKGKKKKKGELTDYNKEFEHESALLKNLLIDQNKFVDSLQQKYNLMENTKSAQRGVGKFTTDLIESINSGRTLSMHLVDKLISTKKTIADLSMKEKKELKASQNGDLEDLNAYSANFLKQMLNEGRGSLMGENYDMTVEDSDPDSLFDTLQNELGDSDLINDEEVDKYLQYENEGVTVYLIEDSVNNEMWFEARNNKGESLDDYPLPKLEGININRITNIATDKYSRKYPVEYI